MLGSKKAVTSLQLPDAELRYSTSAGLPIGDGDGVGLDVDGVDDLLQLVARATAAKARTKTVCLMGSLLQFLAISFNERCRRPPEAKPAPRCCSARST